LCIVWVVRFLRRNWYVFVCCTIPVCLISFMVKNSNKRSIFPQPHIMVVVLAQAGTLVPSLPRQTWSRYHHSTSGLRESFRRAAAAYATAALPLPPTPRSCQAAAAAAMLATASEVLPPRFHRRRCLRFHCHRRRHFCCRCRQCIQLIDKIIVVCVPAIAVTTGVFIATATARSGRMAAAAAMPDAVALPTRCPPSRQKM
jgi:hypothetical protein